MGHAVSAMAFNISPSPISLVVLRKRTTSITNLSTSSHSDNSFIASTESYNGTPLTASTESCTSRTTSMESSYLSTESMESNPCPSSCVKCQRIENEGWVLVERGKPVHVNLNDTTTKIKQDSLHQMPVQHEQTQLPLNTPHSNSVHYNGRTRSPLHNNSETRIGQKSLAKSPLLMAGTENLNKKNTSRASNNMGKTENRMTHGQFGGLREVSTCTGSYSVDLGTGSFTPDQNDMSSGDEKDSWNSCEHSHDNTVQTKANNGEAQCLPKFLSGNRNASPCLCFTENHFGDEEVNSCESTSHVCKTSGRLINNLNDTLAQDMRDDISDRVERTSAEGSASCQPCLCSENKENVREDGLMSSCVPEYGDRNGTFTSLVCQNQLEILNSFRGTDTGEFIVPNEGQGNDLESRGQDTGGQLCNCCNQVENEADDTGPGLCSENGRFPCGSKVTKLPQVQVNGKIVDTHTHRDRPTKYPSTENSREQRNVGSPTSYVDHKSRIISSQQQALRESLKSEGQTSSANQRTEMYQIETDGNRAHKSGECGSSSTLGNSNGTEKKTLPEFFPFTDNPRPFSYGSNKSQKPTSQATKNRTTAGKGGEENLADKNDREKNNGTMGNGEMEQGAVGGREMNDEGRNKGLHAGRNVHGRKIERVQSEDGSLTATHPRGAYHRFHSEGDKTADIMSHFLAVNDTVDFPQYFDAYLCVSRQDLTDFGIPFLRFLEQKCDLKIFLPPRDLLPGDFEFKLLSRVVSERCSCKVVVILSKYYFSSPECQFITHFTKTLDPDAKNRSVIPVIIDHIESKIPEILRGMTSIRYNQAYVQGWLETKLINAIRS